LNIWLLLVAAEAICMVADMPLAGVVLVVYALLQDLLFLQVQLLQSQLVQAEALGQVVLTPCFLLLPLMVAVVEAHQKIKLEPVEALEVVAQVIAAVAVLAIRHQQVHHKAVMVAVLQVKALLFILTMVAVVVVLQPLDQPLLIQVLQLPVLVALVALVQHHQFLVHL
jgi:hypothetical protein